MPDPQTAKIAVDGKKVNPEDLPAYTEFKKKEISDDEKAFDQWIYDSEDITDFSKLEEVNKAIVQVKLKKSRVNRRLKVARKAAAGAKYYYERAKRRQIVTVSGSSDRMRVAMAEIFTEELEVDYIVASTEEEEMKSLLRNLTKEAEDLKEISYNIRRELDIM